MDRRLYTDTPKPGFIKVMAWRREGERVSAILSETRQSTPAGIHVSAFAGIRVGNDFISTARP